MPAYCRSAARRIVASVLAEEWDGVMEIGRELPPAEPFGIAHGCDHPMGHYPIKDRTRIVCAHCAVVFWEG